MTTLHGRYMLYHVSLTGTLAGTPPTFRGIVQSCPPAYRVPNYPQVLPISGKLSIPRINPATTRPVGRSTATIYAIRRHNQNFIGQKNGMTTKTPVTNVTGVAPITC
jgi:hypothetical protein